MWFGMGIRLGEGLDCVWLGSVGNVVWEGSLIWKRVGLRERDGKRKGSVVG